MFKKLSFIKSNSRLLLALAVAAFILSFIFSLGGPEKAGQPTAEEAIRIVTEKNTITTVPTGQTAQQSSRPDRQNTSAAAVIQKNNGTASLALDPTPTVTPINISPTPTSNPVPTPTATSTPLPKPKIALEIIFPSETLNLSEEIKDGTSACDLLGQAKNEGKIKSLTIDNSYLSTLKSAYVYEINGYRNSWTFTVNGNSPQGCSLSFPKPNDSVVWKFSQ